MLPHWSLMVMDSFWNIEIVDDHVMACIMKVKDCLNKRWREVQWSVIDVQCFLWFPFVHPPVYSAEWEGGSEKGDEKNQGRVISFSCTGKLRRLELFIWTGIEQQGTRVRIWNYDPENVEQEQEGIQLNCLQHWEKEILFHRPRRGGGINHYEKLARSEYTKILKRADRYVDNKTIPNCCY